MRYKKTPAFIPDPADQLTGFLDSRCIIDPNAHALPGSLYPEFVNYCCSIRQNWASRRKFTIAMEQAGFSRRTTTRLGPHWVGIGIKPRG
jgi:hypothetical protein